MLQLVNAHEKQKIKNSICKESNKFVNQLDLIPNEIGIKDKAFEAARNTRIEAIYIYIYIYIYIAKIFFQCLGTKSPT